MFKVLRYDDFNNQLTSFSSPSEFRIQYRLDTWTYKLSDTVGIFVFDTFKNACTFLKQFTMNHKQFCIYECDTLNSIPRQALDLSFACNNPLKYDDGRFFHTNDGSYAADAILLKRKVSQKSLSQFSIYDSKTWEPNYDEV